ncbi:hypothetical protein K3495_g5779 [Podosphaera aphanis]|nr:hypothetical protein K3495_g5779 [Podosphaera aphanis]
MLNILIILAALASLPRSLAEAPQTYVSTRTSQDVLTSAVHINCTSRFYDGTNALDARNAYMVYEHKPDAAADGTRRRPYPRRYNIGADIYPTNPGPYDLFPITQTGAYPESEFDGKDFVVIDAGAKVADVVAWKGRSEYERCLVS